LPIGIVSVRPQHNQSEGKKNYEDGHFKHSEIFGASRADRFKDPMRDFEIVETTDEPILLRVASPRSGARLC
jgi:hypothetical protein